MNKDKFANQIIFRVPLVLNSPLLETAYQFQLLKKQVEAKPKRNKHRRERILKIIHPYNNCFSIRIEGRGISK
jgi:uncharacterized membrane protein YkgB